MNSQTLPAAPGRRAFMTGAALAAAAAAVASFASPHAANAVTPALTFAQIPGTGDVKVLNYALALEALETDLYVQALQRLTTGGTNALGIRIPGLHIGHGKPDVQYLREFGKVEREHRDFLNGALGASSILVDPAFQNVKFNFGIEKMTRKQVVQLVYTAEKLGVSAYLGAIPSLATKTYLQAAGAIQGTEARHTAVIADVLNELFNAGLTVAPLATDNNGRDVPIVPDTVLATVSPFIVLA